MGKLTGQDIISGYQNEKKKKKLTGLDILNGYEASKTSGYFQESQGNLGQTIAGSATDVTTHGTGGLLDMGETILDALMYASTYYTPPGQEINLSLADLQKRQQLNQQFIQQDLYNGQEVAKALISDNVKNLTGIDSETMSVFGDKSDSIAASGGQLLGQIGANIAVPGSGLAMMGASAFGGEVENAFNNGATFEEAGVSGAITAGGEVLSEKLFGFFGAKGMDKIINKTLANKLSNSALRALGKMGVDALGEGTEEILSGITSAIGQKLTYMEEKEINELFTREDALDSFIAAIVLGLFGGGADATKSVVTGKDMVTDLTKNEEAVVEAIVQERMEENKAGLGQVTSDKDAKKQLEKYREEAREMLKKGEVSVDVIEKALGGDTLTKYNDSVSKLEEYNKLNKIKTSDLTGEQSDRLAELKEQVKAGTLSEDGNLKLKQQLSEQVSKLTENDQYIRESYNEKAKRSQAFEADLSQYDEKAQATIQKAIDSGILNNTKKTHVFVDLVAKLSADKGVVFDFSNSQRIKESGFAINGKTVNGYVQGNNITLNINSAQALNKVVGHEITHVLEGTDLYNDLQTTLESYLGEAEYKSRLQDVVHRYRKVFEGDTTEKRMQQYKEELTADLVGELIFSDTDFVNRLSVEKPNIFQKLFEEIKYMCKIAAAGSQEAKKLEKVKRAFEKAYRETKKNSELTVDKEADIRYNKYSLYEQIVRKKRKTNQNEFWVNDFDNCYKVRIDEDLSYVITDTIPINGNEDYIKEIMRSIKDVNASRKNTSNSDEHSKSYGGINSGDYAESQGEQSWSEFIDELLEKFESEGIVRKYNSSQGRSDSEGRKYSVNNETSSNDDVFFDSKTKYSFSGEKALSADHSQLAIAREMDENGENAEVIRQSTGWHRGYDGKWRFEIDDSAMEVDTTGKFSQNPDVRRYQELFEKAYVYVNATEEELSELQLLDKALQGVSTEPRTLGDLIKHPKLFEAYPELGNIAISFDKNVESGKAAFHPGFNEIVLSSSDKLNKNVLKKTLIHEIQHVIQEMEGFASGASSQYWDRQLHGIFDSRPQSVREEEKQLENQWLELIEKDNQFALDMEKLLSIKPNIPRAKVDFDTLQKIEEDPIEWQQYDAERKALEKKYGSERVFDYIQLKYKMSQARKNGIRDSRQLYWDTAGEIEARDTAKRLDYDGDDRAAFAPKSKLENVDKDNVVFANKYSLSSDNNLLHSNKDIYGKDIELITPEQIAPVQENAEGVNVSLPENTTPDLNLPLPDGYPSKPVETVKERNATKLRELNHKVETDRQLQKETHNNFNKQIADIQSAMDKVEELRKDAVADFKKKIYALQTEYDAKENKTTKAANELRQKIERLNAKQKEVDISYENQLLDMKHKIEDIIVKRNNNDASYEKRISDTETRIKKMNTKEFKTAEQRMTKQQEYRKLMSDLIGDTAKWIDKKLGLSYSTKTLRRNLRDIVRDENGNPDYAKADMIYDELQGKYNHNEALLNREANEIKKAFRELKLTKEEDIYVQMLGEYRYNPDTTILAEDMTEFFEKNKDKIDEEKVDKAIESARKLYDSLFSRVNEVLKEQGMKELGYREGYFPHFTEDEQSWLARLLNWKTKKNDIPTDIAGMTEQFNPNRSWQSFNKHRTGDSTEYSFSKGLDTYVQGALDWIYHIEDIQKRRAFENEIRYRHSEQGVQDKVQQVFDNEDYDADEMQAQIDAIYAEADNPLNNFITDFRTGTNILAGKKNSMDRGLEQLTNRHIYSTMTNLSNRVTANMVGGSISSALTNFIPITQSWGEVSPISSLKAMKDTIRSAIQDDGIVDKSDFLTNRLRKNDNLYKNGWDKAAEKVGIMMEIADGFTSQTVWRSKYLENIASGMSESAAIKNADQFAENVIAGRSRGNMPTIFDAKNPLFKVFTAFQLEVNNQYQYMFEDLPKDIKNKTTGNMIKAYGTMFLGAYFYNAAYSAMTGRDVAFDPIGMLEELLKDLGWFGEDEEEEPVDALLGLMDSVIGQTPFVSGLWGGGRIPLASALPYEGIKELFTELPADIAAGDTANIINEMTNPLYYLLSPVGGGGQIRKTIQGLSMFTPDKEVKGSYTTGGRLRYEVEQTPLSMLQAALFGQWANENAVDYIDKGRTPLTPSQLEEFTEADMPMKDYWKYRDGLKGIEKNKDKADYIANLDLSTKQKNILINNVYDRDTPIDLTGYENYSNFEEFDFAMTEPEKYTLVKPLGGWDSYQEYTEALKGIEGDKDEDGETINGSRKKNLINALNDMDIEYGQKLLLFKSKYKADDSYNLEIINYLNEREDITAEEMRKILEALDFTVDANGKITW